MDAELQGKKGTVKENKMTYQQNKNRALTITGEVGRLREGEKFYKEGMKLPFTVIDPFHKMGVKCHHPRRKGFSYFNSERLFAIDLRYAPIHFGSRLLASCQQQQKELNNV